jgi:signal transduction histidine kinase/DNA-binding response OmpR family regulator
VSGPAPDVPLDAGFLQRGGDMGRRIAAHPWSATPLGPIETWSGGLRTSLSICLQSRFPIVIFWGPELRLLYNDAYAPALGAKHPDALGRPGLGPEGWAELADVIEPMLRGVLERGEASWSEDGLLLVQRNGFAEEAYFTFSYSPIVEDSGEIGGVFCAVQETTGRVIGTRRLRTLRRIGDATADARTAVQAARAGLRALGEDRSDVPASALYLRRPDGLRLAATCHADAPEHPDPAVAAAAAGRDPAEVGSLGGLRLRDSVPAMPRRALAVPLRAGPGADVVGVLVAAVSPWLAFDDEQRDFLGLAAAALAQAVGGAQAHEAERERTAALSALDEAKTAFFSNVSHEFRTPLTLLLGPLEDVLGGAGLADGDRQALEIARRNALRLRRLVNSLLDFSRAGSGRLAPSFAPVDLPALTAGLAEAFRGTVEGAGLRFEVDCPPLREPVFLDPGLWETVVLNLLSNAFKFTLEGGVAVRVREDAQGAALSVADTGVGIPQEALATLFERFERVPGTAGRSQEGSGIGLALVHELVAEHGGTVEVASTVGEGTTFTVRLPFGRAHLPADRLADGTAGGDPLAAAEPYVAEASRWTGMVADGGAATLPAGDRRRVLVADDNADLRAYLERLLAGEFDVTTVADGEAALAAVRRHPPDLLVTDVMMPRLDGLGLVRALRADPRTARLPILMLSARAGQEASVEGLEVGADDYLVKPFSALELLARVRATLALADAREEAGRRAVAHAERLEALTDAAQRVTRPLATGAVAEALARAAREVTGAAGASVDAPGARAATGRDLAAADVRLSLLGAESAVVGELTLHGMPGALDEETRALLAQLAIVGAGALERAGLHERERETVAVLQRSLLDERLPDLPGLSAAARYLPSSDTAQVGGDFYDLLELDEDRVAIAVGDVVGHGLPAAAAMSHLRNAVRAYASDALAPGEVVERMHRLVARTETGLSATLAVLELDRATGVLRHAAAGHPPGLVIAPDGRTRFLARATSPPLGMPGGIVPEQEDRLDPEDVLLLFTDGLVERRGESLHEGFARLAELAGAPRGDLDAWLDGLLDRHGLADGGEDDVAAVAVRRSSVPPRTFDRDLPLDPACLGVLRDELGAWLQDAGAGQQRVRDVVLAVNEAAMNGMEHGGGRGRLRVRLRLADGRLRAEVADPGTWLERPRNALRGNGLLLMRRLADEVRIDRRPDGTTVRLSWERPA